MEQSRRRVGTCIPESLRNIFYFEEFNQMQSEVYPAAYGSDENVVVAAPSGSGKTVIMELAICRAYLQFGRKLKCVYIAPNKALCQQRWIDWQTKFSPLNLAVLEVTGDSDVQNCLHHISQSSIIITTPEKWDCMTRCWRNHTFVLCGVHLLLIDEAHHLAESERGGVLETVIVRMILISKTKSYETSNKLRIIALSATMPNIEDIGLWLGCRNDTILRFDDSFRPVPLTIKTIAYPNRSNPFLFERSLESKVKDVVQKYSDGKQTIVFCPSKKNCESQSTKLSQQQALPFKLPSPIIQQELNLIQNASLRYLCAQGYGFHHSGLSPDDRTIVERLFYSGYIQILCSTTTLAQGMNLPAHLVVIKGTLSWRGSEHGYQKLCRSDARHDIYGRAIIMTSQEDESYYAAIDLTADRVESKLKSMIVEAIAAEISQRTITSFDDCITWMKSTLFYVSLRKSIVCDDDASEAKLEGELKDLSSKTLMSLQQQKLIEMNDALQINPLPEVHIMSRNLTKFSSMVLLLKAGKLCDLQGILSRVANCEELHVHVRKSDKKLLNSFSQWIRFPIKERVQHPIQKAFVLLQSVVSSKCIIHDFQLKIEQAEVVGKAVRLLRTFRELCISKGWGKSLESAILLDRALNVRLWEWKNSNAFEQCPGLSLEMIEKLSELGIRTFHQVEGLSSGMLSHQLGCSNEQAEAIIKFGLRALKSQVTVQMESINSALRISLKREAPNGQGEEPFDISYELVCYIGDTGELICHRAFRDIATDTTIDIHKNLPPAALKCSLLSSIVGLDYHLLPTVIPPLKYTETTSEPSHSPKRRKVSHSKSSTISVSQPNPFENFRCRNTAMPIPLSAPTFSTEKAAVVSPVKPSQAQNHPLTQHKVKLTSRNLNHHEEFILPDLKSEIDSEKETKESIKSINLVVAAALPVEEDGFDFAFL